MDEEMKNGIKKIVEDSFDDKIKNSEESRAAYTCKKLNKLYPDYLWNVIYIHKGEHNSYSYNGNDSIFFCNYNKYGVIIYPSERKNSSKKDLKESKDKERLKEEIKSLSKEQSDFKDKLNDSEKIIKNYKSIIDEQKSKLEKTILERESLQKIIEQKEEEIINLKNEKIKLKNEIIDLKNEIQQKKENNAFNKTFYTREQMIALNFESTDSRLRYAIPCLKKDLFVDVEKKLYDKYPQYKEKNNNFLSQGKQILRFKTIEENHLLSGNPIIMPII